MRNRAIAVLTTALLVCMIPVVGFAQLSFYAQDFEALAPVDGSLAGDGWLVFGNIFDPAGNYLWGHGPWPAPNNQTPGNWEDIVSGQGGPAQEIQQLVVYSDYGNGEHANGNLVESNLFQERTIDAGDSGLWYFTFDAKMGDLGGSSTAAAFIKTLDPGAGWAMTNFITADMTSTPGTWTDYMLSIDVTGLGGQILQFGFMTVATHYEPCGVFYDNVAFSHNGVVPTESASWGSVKSMYK